MMKKIVGFILYEKNWWKEINLHETLSRQQCYKGEKRALFVSTPKDKDPMRRYAGNQLPLRKMFVQQLRSYARVLRKCILKNHKQLH